MSTKIKKLIVRYKILFIIIGILFFLPIAYYLLQFIYIIGKYFGIFMRNIYEIVTNFS